MAFLARRAFCSKKNTAGFFLACCSIFPLQGGVQSAIVRGVASIVRQGARELEQQQHNGRAFPGIGRGFSVPYRGGCRRGKAS